MHIFQIELDNFKSFGEKTTIPFRRGFTTISGPNGSGKSNIIDSILFCLGLSSSRTMRAEKLPDLINHLSRRREAQVTITFEKDPADSPPSTEQVQQQPLLAVLEAPPDSATNTAIEDAPTGEAKPLTPEAPTGETLVVSRRIKDGPNGYTSTYYLNGRVSSLTEIHEKLGRFNISPGCYNVMMQGDVAGIVNMSPMERRKIIDEIAGVAEFDRKIDQAQRELEATGANIERNTILLGEIEARLEQLATERDVALKYQKLRNDRQGHEGQLLTAKFLDLKKALDATQQNLAEARRKKTETETALRRWMAEIGETREELNRLSNEVKKKGEDQHIALQKQIEGLKGHISRKQDSIRFIDEQQKDHTKSIERMEADILRQQEKIESINAEIEGFEYQLKELQGLYDVEAKAYEGLNRQFDQLTDSGGELSVKRAEIRQNLEAVEDALSHLQREKLDIEADLKRLDYEEELYTKTSSETVEKRHTLTDRQNVLQAEVETLTQEKTRLEEQIRETQLTYSQTRVAVNNAQASVNQLSREYMQRDAQKKAFDEVNFGRAVDTVLNAGISGVHGTLAQLGSVDSEYSLALETALGGRIQNIVVDDDRVAQAGIELLQRTRAGRATFLPLTKIQAFRGLPALPYGDGIIDYAYNLMDFDGAYSDIFGYALGDTLIVQDMQAARKLLRKYRMVTLDGSLLEKSGAMSGGSQPNRGGGGRLSNSGKLEQEMRELQAKLTEAEAEKERFQKQLTQLELRMDALKQDYSQTLQRHTRAEAELAGVTAQLVELQPAASQHPKTEALAQRRTELTQRLEALTPGVSSKEQEAATLRQALEAIESQIPAGQIDALRKEMAEVKFQMDYYDSQLRNVQADIKGKTLERNHQEVGMQHYTERIQELKETIQSLEKEKQGHGEEIQLTALQMKELEAQTTELDEELKLLQAERDAVQAKLLEQEKAKYGQERQLAQLDEQILSFQHRKRELDPQIATARAELEKAGVNPDTVTAAELPSEDEIQRKINSLTRQMEALEPVNMLAIQEFDDVNGRKSELSDKIDTLSREREALEVKIAGYQELKRASFMKAFENVDNNFRGIFAELSDGVGQLLLTNPEEPFSGGLTIQAQPRGKKMQRLEAMSGGEKSLTSLAFVFSLQRYMPAPFYALDEVDMNLDGINAEKLANMVKRESNAAQFLVVSLRKPMLEHSDRTVGVTQKRDGVSKVTGVKLRDDAAAN